VSTTASRPLTGDLVIEVAGRIVDEQGSDALTMRRLADELGVAVTSIYWHVGNREDLVDALVDRLLADMGTLRPRGTTPRERIASLSRALRRKLLERPHLIALAHEQEKTALMFQPVQAAIAEDLTAPGLRDAEAALALRALQLHVVASVLLERTIGRYGTEQPVDPLEAFEFTLQAMLDALTARASGGSQP
jgi:TetR/AcrR family transcriptional regulator, tetracycline repressor protein